MGKQVGARFNGGVAQLGEHLPCKQGVKSSNLSISTHLCKDVKELSVMLAHKEICVLE